MATSDIGFHSCTIIQDSAFTTRIMPTKLLATSSKSFGSLQITERPKPSTRRQSNWSKWRKKETDFSKHRSGRRQVTFTQRLWPSTPATKWPTPSCISTEPLSWPSKRTLKSLWTIAQKLWNWMRATSRPWSEEVGRTLSSRCTKRPWGTLRRLTNWTEATWNTDSFFKRQNLN